MRADLSAVARSAWRKRNLVVTLLPNMRTTFWPGLAGPSYSTTTCRE